MRLLDPVLARLSSLVMDVQPSTGPGVPDAHGPIHSLQIGDVRVALDVSTSRGYEHKIDGGGVRGLSKAEARLMLLDWTRARMPVATPSALWIVEAAALAATDSDRHWREWASADLHSALVALLNSPINWTETTQARIRSAMETAAVEPAGVDRHELSHIVREAKVVVASRWDSEIRSAPAPESVAGCSEVEWDQVRPVDIDLGELGLRSRIFGTVWTASIAQHPRHRRGGTSGPLWARLVDTASGLVHDEVEMRVSDGLFVARGYVPPAARAAATRVDLTADPSRAARVEEERQNALLEQRWFRTLFFRRRGVGGPVWAEWSATYQSRLTAESGVAAESCLRPFLAEWHLQPADLASVSQRLLSPGPDSLPPKRAC